MTRSKLDRTLRRTYVVLGVILAISVAAKLAPRIPGLEGTQAARFATDIYDYLKDMSLVLVTVVAAYLANVFQKRSKFIERLEEEWRGIVRTKSALFAFCEKANPSPDDYLAAFCRISETIDNMRVVYANVGETDELIGLYPYAPLHDMRRALQTIDPAKGGVSPEERKLIRDAILQAFYALRESFLVELDIGEPDNPIIPHAARRRKQPGATRRAQRLKEKQAATYTSHPAPRRAEIDELLGQLRTREEPA
ncbi:conserved protein of unknown function [Hyphomicrobium sp. 1Nfss2.1]|uniref:hypothetical protein n=1 Tax=Hyphomicrobium sp. 1Nfss2.1 TaxID=3413936 RepID=UPI003C7A8A00